MTAILITGGTGDVIVLESHFPQELKDSLTTIYYACSSYAPLRSYFEALPNYPQLRNHISLWDDFSRFRCFLNKAHVTNTLLGWGKRLPADWNKVDDWSIAQRFPLIEAGIYPRLGSSGLHYRLAPLTIDLPERYNVVVPCTPNDRGLPARAFDDAEWIRVVDYLRQLDLPGVILNSPNADPRPADLIDLTGQTTILESIEILKRAQGYIGIDSCLSVLAARYFDPACLRIKVSRSHAHHWKGVYWPGVVITHSI